MKKLFSDLFPIVLAAVVFSMAFGVIGAAAADIAVKGADYLPKQRYHDNGDGSWSLQVAEAPATFVDHSGTVTTGGVAQVVIPANSSRRKWRIQNTDISHQEVLWVRDDGQNASAGAGSYALAPSSNGAGGYIEGESAGMISIYAATTGHSFSASEY